MDSAVDAGNEVELPGTALDLPYTKSREQDAEQQRKREKRDALRRPAGQGSAFPPAAVGIMFELR